MERRVSLPPEELLEANHSFPGTYVFKAVGSTANGFAARVVAAVREELELAVDPQHSLRHTAAGRHVSVTLEVEMESAGQVLAVYARIREVEGLVLLL
jgi:putative lipoic acid-binding regulatory protein